VPEVDVAAGQLFVTHEYGDPIARIEMTLGKLEVRREVSRPVDERAENGNLHDLIRRT
jgi:hypothetical protein